MFRESEGSFKYGNYRREAEDLRAVVEHFKAEGRCIVAIVGHSKGVPYVVALLVVELDLVYRFVVDGEFIE